MAQDNDHFVGMGDIELAAQQFTDEVGIRMFRIEERNPVTQIVTTGGQPLYFGISLIKQGKAVGPSQKAAGSGHSKKGKRNQEPGRHSARQLFTAQIQGVVNLVHKATESQLCQPFKPFSLRWRNYVH